LHVKREAVNDDRPEAAPWLLRNREKKNKMLPYKSTLQAALKGKQM
jgi:hypothetical protein